MMPEPILTEKILNDDHNDADKCCISGSYFVVVSKPITTENNGTYNGLQQIVGQAHATKQTEMMHYALKSWICIPEGDYGRDDA